MKRYQSRKNIIAGEILGFESLEGTTAMGVHTAIKTINQSVGVTDNWLKENRPKVGDFLARVEWEGEFFVLKKEAFNYFFTEIEEPQEAEA